MKLKRLKQCAKCPWKVSTDPHDIPNFCCSAHASSEYRELYDAARAALAAKDEP